MKFTRALLMLLVLIFIIGVAVMRQDLLHMPKVRVGPLNTELAEKPKLRFFALGDTGTGGEGQFAVGRAMEARCNQLLAEGSGDLDGILLLGDNAYPIGFSGVEDGQWRSKIVDPYSGSCLSKVPIYPVLGNHDYKQNPGAEIEYTLINPRWRLPNRFYSLSWGHLLKIIALDSNLSDMCFNPSFCGLDFLTDHLKMDDARWTLVMAHHPIASLSDHGFNYRGGLRGLILKPYLCSRIDAYLSGHSHHLEYREPAGCRMGIFVSGGGGGDLYQTIPDTEGEVRFVKSSFGFLEIEVSNEQMTSRFWAADSQKLYEISKRK